MIKFIVVSSLVIISLGAASGVSAQRRPSPSLSPRPQSAVPNPAASGQLVDPNGGLFSNQTKAKIGFPNLIRSFTGGDFLGDAFTFGLNILTTFGGIIAFGYLIYGGVKFITSGGNPAAAEEGKKMIVGAIVGVLIVALAYVIVLTVRSSITG